AAALRGHGDREQEAGRHSGARRVAEARGHARVPQGAPVACGGRVPQGRAGSRVRFQPDVRLKADALDRSIWRSGELVIRLGDLTVTRSSTRSPNRQMIKTR